MVIKSVAYRLGYGKNLHGIFLDANNVITILYKNRDGAVSSKNIVRRAGKVDVSKGLYNLNATEAILLPSGKIVMTKGNHQIKII